MLFTILCYHTEATTTAWTKEEDDAVLAKLHAVHAPLLEAGKLGPVVRLQPTPGAATIRNPGEPAVMDGPFAETKEQLLGFYVVDCASMDEAVDIAKSLSRANPGGAYEVRPMQLFRPGALAP
ncbi:YciI family protein [Acuticoccus kandeliae]|uniref:YciI family protein n=1 Tax=Acuticoccus kandeliae TaxID=2073160 RepID=UPI000D3E3B2A|nr:YciI family protein [Acuticoccus kandeliae]